MIEFQQFSKEYNGDLVVSADLKLEQGLYWLKAGNGTGKTTLLQSMGGLIPFDGNIRVNGLSVKNNSREYRKTVNYAEAEPLYPEFLTGRDLIRFYLETKTGDPAAADIVSHTLGVDAFAGKKLGTYSSGMAKKLSLLLAFIGNPSLILLDEPLITLDKESVTLLYDLIRKHLKYPKQADWKQTWRSLSSYGY
ncbi:MAG: ATP-binding cassette domain-containing protein [Sphingobacteriales bacterium]|nr:MAG: ATP-binding cassette domain-containing protein [Sphingobacteriales bacterium]